ncbi:MAG: 16S rRNA processing protein RimM [Clostridia bacterium]|nr:16S rRNA processing protein RimM [Clostridia bacterium]
MLSTHLLIGEILKPQGIRGEVKVRPITNDPMRFDGLEFVYFKAGEDYQKRGVRVTRIDGDAVYMLVDGVGDRDAAEKLRGLGIYVDRAHSVPLDEDTNFICDLIGCRGVDDRGTELGVMTDVLQPGANDVYVFRGERGECLVPALKSVVVSVDVENRLIVFDAQRLSEVAVFDED